MQVLPSRPLARSSSISRSSPSMSCSMSAVAQLLGPALQEGAAPQLRLEHALLDAEVLPHRPGHGEAGAVGPAQHVHHVGDHGGDDLDVVRGHVGGAAQPVRGAEVGDAEPQREDPVAVLVDGAGDARRGSRRASRRCSSSGDSRTGIAKSRRPLAASARGERLQEGHAALLGELRQHESGQQPDGGAEPVAPGRGSARASRTRMNSSGAPRPSQRRGRRTAGRGSPRPPRPRRRRWSPPGTAPSRPRRGRPA